MNAQILPKILDRSVTLLPKQNKPHLMAIGSILHFSKPLSLIWGSGAIAATMLPEKSNLRESQIYALRGKLSADALTRCNYRMGDIAFGDPALFVGRFFPIKKQPAEKIGIIPHYADRVFVENNIDDHESEFRVIDVAEDLEKFLAAVASCRAVLSSSLHGLIIADTLGVPNQWVRFSDKILGAGFKFKDYYSTTDSPNRRAIDLRDTCRLKKQHLLAVASGSELSTFKEGHLQLLNALPDWLRKNAGNM